MNLLEVLKDKCVVADGWCRGYPKWKRYGLFLYSEILKVLIGLLKQKFSVSCVFPSVLASKSEFLSFYKNYKIYDSIPEFVYKDKSYVFVTDALPYNLIKIDQTNFDAVVACYSIIRLLKCKVRPMYKDYYIFPVTQIDMQIDRQDLPDKIIDVKRILQQFMKSINLNTLILEYDGKKNYSEKIYMVCAVDGQNKLQSMIQWSILSPDLIENVIGAKDLKSFFDIGFSHKLVAMWVDNHRDRYGIYFPSKMRKIQVLLAYKNSNGISAKILEFKDSLKDSVHCINTLGDKKINLKKAAAKLGLAVLAIHRRDKDREFFDVFTRNSDTKVEVENVQELISMIKSVNEKTDEFFYMRKNDIFQSFYKKGLARIDDYKNLGRIIY